ncbi:MAG: GntR family transcriptional regulator [Verrucomicrobiae bacterium]|nr:GntR family transcriptional regulator [Verrucomicrobiae bacterium]
MSETAFALDLNEVKNLSTLIADKLTESVMNGALMPGEHLVQTNLASKFGVSRVAIRDALQELRKRGLAVNVPLKGTMVRPISEENLRNLFEIRRLLEPAAAAKAVSAMKPSDKARLELLLEQQTEAGDAGEMEKVIDLDWEFHQVLYSSCGNQDLLQIVTYIWSQIRQARGLAQSNPRWGEQWSQASLKRHRQILAAVRRKDQERTRKLVDDGIVASEEEILNGLNEAGWLTLETQLS